MLQVLRGTGGVWHCHKNQHTKKYASVFWKRKLVTSILINQACRHQNWPSFRCKHDSAMIPAIISCL